MSTPGFSWPNYFIILFFQDIGMEHMSYFPAFARLAHVQCVSFGHPDTTGIPNVDYFVSNDLEAIELAAIERSRPAEGHRPPVQT
jgi:hypothetical protein